MRHVAGLFFTSGCVTVCMLCGFAAAAQTEKLLDTTLFPSNEQTYRWSEASTISLDDEGHLLMALTLFGLGGHDNTAANILEFHSHDGGLTWTPYEEATIIQENVGDENTMSPALLRLDNGDILCFVNVKNSITDCGPWVKRSTDGAKTWGELKRLPYEGYGGVGSDRAIQISTGRVLVPCWTSLDSLGSTRVVVHYSDDRGETWASSPIISTPAGSTGRKTDPAAEEPMIIELNDGRLMMVMRTYLKSIYQSFSDDGGATWSDPASSGIPSPGSMTTIKRMPNGDILLIWNWAELGTITGPWPRNFITTAVSTDDGKTFSSVRHLDGADDFEGKITMANVVFSGGNAVITYSKSMTKKNAYNWRLQVIPIPWFYEGDKEQVYGESYLPTLEAELNAAHVARESGDVVLPKLKRPSSEARAAALTPAHVAESDQFGLVASYHFERNEGEFAFDVTGRHDLTFVAVEGWPHWADGPEGHSIQFNGKHGVLACPDAESLHFPENCFTVEALLYPTARKKHAIIVTKEHQFEVGLLDGRLKAAVRCGGEWGPGWVGNTEIPLNEWTRIAVTFDGMWLRLFVGGVLVDSALVRGRMDVTDEALVVGGSTNIGDPVFAGHIDELRIWNTVRFEATEGLGLAAGSEEPRPVGAQHQLFIDDSLIAANQGLERVVNQPAKHQANPVLTYEKPWEGNCVIAWGSVLYDETDKLFKFWYMVYKKFAKNDDPILVCYATSRDGLHWDKPDLGLVDYLGSTANNIVLWPKGDLIDAPTVIAVPDPTPECKYRMYYHGRNPNGIRTATSPDGIHWTMQDGVCIESGDRSAAYYDTERGAYCVITRVPERGIRTCGLWESKDGETFEFIGEVLAADDRDPEETQLYGMIPFNYEGIRIGFLEPFFIPTRKLNTQLAYSLDGHAWHRACDRQTFLEYGSDGSWDQAWVTPSQNPPIRVGDTLYIFYQGRQTLHWAVEPYGHIGSIGLALLRPDGFVSLDAQCAPGSVITAPLLLNGTTLHLNAVARPGSVTVDVLEESGAPVEGFTRGDCVPLENTDTLDHTVAWKHGRDLTALKGKPVRLQFHIQAAKLYSFWME